MFSVKKCSKNVPIINRMLIVHKSQCISSGLLGPSTDREEVIKYAKTILRQKIYLLRIVTANDYILRIYPSSSIGAHIRHSLDHFNTILRYREDPGNLNYDERNRRSDIEECRRAAIRSCELLIQSLDNVRFDEVVKVKFMSDHLTGSSYTLSSNVGREISFVTHHAVHHLSTIVGIMKILKYEIDEKNIGVASSTSHDQLKRSD